MSIVPYNNNAQAKHFYRNKDTVAARLPSGSMSSQAFAQRLFTPHMRYIRSSTAIHVQKGRQLLYHSRPSQIAMATHYIDSFADCRTSSKNQNVVNRQEYSRAMKKHEALAKGSPRRVVDEDR